MISFGVSSLLTMVPLDYTIDLTLKPIYGNKKIETKISRNDMKNLLTLCTKNVHFTFGNNIYQQKHGARNVYGTFRKNTHTRTREIYETLEKICG